MITRGGVSLNGKLKKVLILLMVSVTLFASGWLNVFSGDFITLQPDDVVRVVLTADKVVNVSVNSGGITLKSMRHE